MELELDELDAMIDETLGIEIIKDTSNEYFVRKQVIPLGVQQQPENYATFIPEDEEVNISIPSSSTSNNLHIAYVEGARRGKTRTSKNIVLSMYEFGYSIIVFEPKINDWYQSKFLGEGKFLHPSIKNSKMQLSNYVPSYLESEIPDDQKENYKIFSPSISSFVNADDWEKLGVSPVASETISSFVLKCHQKDKTPTLDDIEYLIRNHKEITKGTKNSALTAIRNLKSVNFFNYPEIPIEGEWKNKKVVIVSFPGGEGKRMNIVIEKTIKRIEKIGIKEKKHNLEITRKMVVFEDCSSYATSADSTPRAIKYVQNNMGAYGLNSLLLIQLPDLIPPTLIDGCNIKIIGFVNNMESISKHLPDAAKRSLKYKPLYSNKDKYLFERIMVEDNEFTRYYPYDCRVGHKN